MVKAAAKSKAKAPVKVKAPAKAKASTAVGKRKRAASPVPEQIEAAAEDTDEEMASGDESGSEDEGSTFVSRLSTDVDQGVSCSTQLAIQTWFCFTALAGRFDCKAMQYVY